MLAVPVFRSLSNRTLSSIQPEQPPESTYYVIRERGSSDLLLRRRAGDGR